RTGGVAVALAHGLLLGQVGGDLLVPEDLASLGVQAHDVPLERGHVAARPAGHVVAAVTGQEDSPAHDDGTGGAGPRKFGLPCDVLPLTPGRWQSLRATDAQAAEAAELGPVCRPLGAEPPAHQCDEEGDGEPSQRPTPVL